MLFQTKPWASFCGFTAVKMTHDGFSVVAKSNSEVTICVKHMCSCF